MRPHLLPFLFLFSFLIFTKNAAAQPRTEYTYTNGVQLKKVFQDGNLVEVERKVNGEFHGFQETFYPDGSPKSSAEYKNGVKVGQWVDYHPNGNVAGLVNYKNGRVLGKLRFYHADGSIAYAAKRVHDPENPTKDGVIHGKFIERGEIDCIVRKVKFKMGKKHVKWLSYKDCKLESEFTFKNGIPIGKFTTYHPNGNIHRTGTYFDSTGSNLGPKTEALQGLYQEFYPNGNLELEGNLENGRRQGDTRFYDKQGRIIFKRYYKKDLEIALTQYSYHRSPNEDQLSYYRESKLDTNASYKKFITHGLEKRWYDNGQLSSEASYLNGKKHGPFVNYHKNGQIASKGRSEEDKIVGEFVSYYENGNIQRKTTYLKGYNKEIGWTYRYLENGQPERIMYSDSTAGEVMAHNTFPGRLEEFSHSNLFDICYFDNGNIKSIYFSAYNHRQALALIYYLSGELRCMMFEDPDLGELTSVYYSPEHQYAGHHHSSNSSIDIDINLDYASKLVDGLGWMAPKIEGLKFEKTNGDVSIKTHRGKTFFKATLKNGLGEGLAYLLHPATLDTIYSMQLTKGVKNGYYNRYFAGVRPLEKSQNKMGETEFYERYYRDGKPDASLGLNEKGHLIKKEYFIEGGLEYEVNKTTNESSYYRKNGDLSSRYYRDDKDSSLLHYETFHQNNKPSVKGTYKSGKKHGVYINFKENGDTSSFYTYHNDTLEGLAFYTSKKGDERDYGHYEKGIKEGWWYNKKGEKLDSTFYKAGKAQLQLPDEECACIDDSFTPSKRQYYKRFGYHLEEQDFMRNLPANILFDREFNYDKLYYLRHNEREDGSNRYNEFELVTGQELYFYVPAIKAFRVSLNPCWIRSKMSKIELREAHSITDGSFGVGFYVPKIELEFLRAPISTQDKKRVKIQLATKSLRFFMGKGFELDLDPSGEHCYPSFYIKDFIELSELKISRALLSEISNNSLQGLELSLEEIQQFMGLVINSANAKFNLSDGDAKQAISAKCIPLFISGYYITGKVEIPKVVKEGDHYKIGDSAVRWSEDNILKQFSDRGFSRLKIDYNSRYKTLNIQFYAE